MLSLKNVNEEGKSNIQCYLMFRPEDCEVLTKVRMEFYVNIVKMFDCSTVDEVCQDFYLKTLHVKLHHHWGRSFHVDTSLTNNFIDVLGNSDDCDVVDFVVFVLLDKKKQGLKAFLCVLESKSSSHLLFLERIHPLWQLPNLSGHWQFLSAKVKSWASPSVLILFQPERLCCWPLLQSWYGPEFCIHKSYKLLSFFEDTLHVLGLAPNPLHRTEITSCTSASLFFIESCKSLKSKLSRCEMWPQNQPPTTSGLFY